MNRVQAIWQRAKWPLLWVSLVPVLLGVYSVGAHLYIDHANLHTMTQWIQSADRELVALKKAVRQKAEAPK